MGRRFGIFYAATPKTWKNLKKNVLPNFPSKLGTNLCTGGLCADFRIATPFRLKLPDPGLRPGEGDASSPDEYRALPCWDFRNRYLNGYQRFSFGFALLICKTYSSMASTPQAAHAAAQQQSQGALVWIDCEVLSASPLLIAFLIANVSARSHAVFK